MADQNRTADDWHEEFVATLVRMSGFRYDADAPEWRWPALTEALVRKLAGLRGQVRRRAAFPPRSSARSSSA